MKFEELLQRTGLKDWQWHLLKQPTKDKLTRMAVADAARDARKNKKPVPTGQK